LCCDLSSIVGLVLGVVGMRETKRTGQDGYAIALIGRSSADSRRRLDDLPAAVDRHLRQRLAVGAVTS
jgi:hypothetical protein